MPVPPLKPWINRAATSTSIVGAVAHRTLLSASTTVPASNSRRRPPPAVGQRPDDQLSRTEPGHERREGELHSDGRGAQLSDMTGRPGRYMSVASGAVADNSASANSICRGIVLLTN